MSTTIKFLLISLPLGACTAISARGHRIQEPAQGALAATQRAERFLGQVGDLSPLGSDADIDLAQRWPRKLRRSYREYDGVWHEAPRDFASAATVHSASGAPGFGIAWRVSLLGGDIILTVDEDLTTVRRFEDRDLCDLLSYYDAPALASCLTERAAFERALAYVAAANFDLSGFSLETSELVDTGGPPKASDRRWKFEWRRTYQGIPYKSQPAYVALDAGAGRLLEYWGERSAPLPAPFQFQINQTRAEAIAGKTLMEHGHPGMYDPSSSLEIVFPNDFVARFDEHTYSDRLNRLPVSRVAWRVFYYVPPPDPRFGEWRGVMWIDVETGQVIDGAGPGGQLGAKTKTFGKGLLPRICKAISLRSYVFGRGKRSVLALAASKEPLSFYGRLSLIYGTADEKAIKPFAPTHWLSVRLRDGKEAGFKVDAKHNLIRDESGDTARCAPAFSDFVAGRRRESTPER